MARWNQRLRIARRNMGLSLAGAVKLLYEDQKIKMDRNNLRKVEISKSDIPASKLIGLLKIYSMDANWVLGLKDN